MSARYAPNMTGTIFSQAACQEWDRAYHNASLDHTVVVHWEHRALLGEVDTQDPFQRGRR
jgi:hypothetical protein